MRAAKAQAVEAYKPYCLSSPSNQARRRIQIISQEIIKLGKPSLPTQPLLPPIRSKVTSTVTSSTITSTSAIEVPTTNTSTVTKPTTGLSVLEEDLLVSDTGSDASEIPPEQQAVIDAIADVLKKPTILEPSQRVIKAPPAVVKFRNNSRIKDLTTTITKAPASRATLLGIQKTVEADISSKQGKPFSLPNLEPKPKRIPSPTFARFNPGLVCAKAPEPVQNVTIVHHNYGKARGPKQPTAQKTEYQFMTRCQRRNHFKRLKKETKKN